MTAPAAPTKRRRRNPLGLAAIAVIVVAFSAMWIYAFFFASRDNPDQIPDEAWTQRAEATCAVYEERVDALPPARSFQDVEPREEAMRQRADVADEANALLAEQLAALRADPPADDYSAEAVGLWLDDWDRLLAARADHVAEWRQGIDEPFTEPPTEEGKFTPVSLRMDAFAKINRMTSCETPKDMG